MIGDAAGFLRNRPMMAPRMLDHDPCGTDSHGSAGRQAPLAVDVTPIEPQRLGFSARHHHACGSAVSLVRSIAAADIRLTSLTLAEDVGDGWINAD
jgi:hypothetical protein